MFCEFRGYNRPSPARVDDDRMCEKTVWKNVLKPMKWLAKVLAIIASVSRPTCKRVLTQTWDRRRRCLTRNSLRRWAGFRCSDLWRPQHTIFPKTPQRTHSVPCGNTCSWLQFVTCLFVSLPPNKLKGETSSERDESIRELCHRVEY